MNLQRTLKEQIDFFGSIICLVIFFPLFLIIGFLIKLDSTGPVFFRQKRVGKDGKVFRIWKFRTMIENAVNMGLGYKVAKDDVRITKIGKILRRFGIDEFPQVINILTREMSFVGPRPSIPYQVAKYSQLERKRLAVKPGITNINVIKGWNTALWKQRIEQDIWYVENWSLRLDFKIFFKSIFAVLKGKGQYGAKGITSDL